MMEKTTFFAEIGRIRDFCLQPRVFPLLVIVAAAAMRLVAWDWAPLLERDSVAYINAAAVWAATGKYTVPQFPPLPCYLIKLLIQLGLAPETAARIYAFVPGCLVPVTAYALALETTCNRRIARYAAVFFIFHPTLLFFSVMPIRDSLYILLAGLSLLTGFRAVRSQETRRWILFACCSALAWCCRHEGMEFLPLTLLALTFELIKKRYTWRRAALHFLLVLVITPTLWFSIGYFTAGMEPFALQSILVRNHFMDFIKL